MFVKDSEARSDQREAWLHKFRTALPRLTFGHELERLQFVAKPLVVLRSTRLIPIIRVSFQNKIAAGHCPNL